MMPEPLQSKPIETTPPAQQTETQARFKINKRTAVREFTVQDDSGKDHKLLLTIRLPKKDQESYLQKFTDEKINAMGKVSLAVALGAKVSFHLDAEGKIDKLKWHKGWGRTQKLDDKFLEKRERDINKSFDKEKKDIEADKTLTEEQNANRLKMAVESRSHKLNRNLELKKAMQTVQKLWEKTEKAPESKPPVKQEPEGTTRRLPGVAFEQKPIPEKIQAEQIKTEPESEEIIPEKKKHIKTALPPLPPNAKSEAALKFIEARNQLQESRKEVDAMQGQLKEILRSEKGKTTRVIMLERRIENKLYDFFEKAKKLFRSSDPTGDVIMKYFKENPDATLEQLHNFLFEQSKKSEF